MGNVKAEPAEAPMKKVHHQLFPHCSQFVESGAACILTTAACGGFKMISTGLMNISKQGPTTPISTPISAPSQPFFQARAEEDARRAREHRFSVWSSTSCGTHYIRSHSWQGSRFASNTGACMNWHEPPATLCLQGAGCAGRTRFARLQHREGPRGRLEWFHVDEADEPKHPVGLQDEDDDEEDSPEAVPCLE